MSGKLINFVEEAGIDTIDRDAIERFFDYLAAPDVSPDGRWGNPRLTSPLKPGSIETYHIVIKGLFNWLVERGVISRSPADFIERPINRPDQVMPLIEEDLTALLTAVSQSRHAKRDKAIVLLLLGTGMRVSELPNLRLRNVDFDDDSI